MIDVQNLCKVYNLGEVRVDALHDVTLSVERGSFVAIMGPSGSGKSTFVNLLGCLDQPSSGRYWLDGVPVESMDRDQLAAIRNQKIGFIFQTFNLLSRTTALENVELPLLYTEHDVPDVRERAQQSLASVGLSGREMSLPNQLSGGQQQRVAIARALVNNPEILLADEPTGQLDSRTSNEIMAIFQELNRARGITIILITHSEEIANYADRIVRFRDGEIVSDQAVVHPVAVPEATPAAEEVLL
ncbi:MAG: ABC transporter ATP-binding protein [Acidobacteriia bacterium]|nr:ABC transporter ATP-binding protein [Terriglobia bacterium]